MKVYKRFNDEVIKILIDGGIGVLPTDTIYGLVGSALNKKTVTRIYKLRRRNPKKPMIVLIGSVSDLKKFGVKIGARTRKILNKIWPHFRRHALRRGSGYSGQAGKVSVILPCQSPKLAYLHRGTKSIAFRLPAFVTAPASAPLRTCRSAGKPPFDLHGLLKRVGPLVAPSANLSGKPPARTIKEAMKHFGYKVDFYVDAGQLLSKPSTLIEIKKGKTVVLRKGVGRL